MSPVCHNKVPASSSLSLSFFLLLDFLATFTSDSDSADASSDSLPIDEMNY